MKLKLLLPLLIALPVLFLDIGTKYAAFSNLPQPDSPEAQQVRLESMTNPDAFSYFTFTLVFNKGAIFGIFSENNNFWVKQIVLSIFTIIALTVVIIFYSRLNPAYLFPRFLIGAIIGGALGNFSDRLFGYIIYEGNWQFMYGKVVDFIDMGIGAPGGKWSLFGLMDLSNRWPTYNIADACILCSVIMLIIFLMGKNREQIFNFPSIKSDTNSVSVS